MTPVEQITSLYVGYFGRAPEPAGLNYWVGRLADGFSLAEIAESFSVQAESTTKYPFLANPNVASPEAFITQVYLNLFNRLPDAAGLAYWAAELANGADVGDFILNVISGATTAPDSTVIGNKIEVGAYYAETAANEPGYVYDADAAAVAAAVIDGVDDTAASVIEGKNEADTFFDSNTGQTFVLTEGADIIPGLVGSNDTTDTSGDDLILSGTVNAGGVNTLGAADNLNGGAGFDTLRMFDDVGGALVPNTLSVERFDAQSTAGGLTSVNMVNAVGAEQTWNYRSTGNVEYTNVQNEVVVGVFDSNTRNEVTFENGVLLGGDVSLVANRAGVETDFAAIRLNSSDAANIKTVNIAALGGAATTNYLDIDIDNGGFGTAAPITLNITGDAGLVLREENGQGETDALTTIDSTGLAGSLDLDLSDNDEDFVFTGGNGDTRLDASGNGDVTITTGTGDDDIDVSGIGDVTVDTGAGDDMVSLGSEASVDDSVNGGAGVDTIGIDAATLDTLTVDGDFEAVISGFEQVAVTGGVADGDNFTVDLSNLDNINSVILSGSAAGIASQQDIQHFQVNGAADGNGGEVIVGGVRIAIASGASADDIVNAIIAAQADIIAANPTVSGIFNDSFGQVHIEYNASAGDVGNIVVDGNNISGVSFTGVTQADGTTAVTEQQTITVGAAPTATGVFYLGGIAVNVVLGESAAQTAARITTALNNENNASFTATTSGDTVVVTLNPAIEYGEFVVTDPGNVFAADPTVAETRNHTPAAAETQTATITGGTDGNGGEIAIGAARLTLAPNLTIDQVGAAILNNAGNIVSANSGLIGIAYDSATNLLTFTYAASAGDVAAIALSDNGTGTSFGAVSESEAGFAGTPGGTINLEYVAAGGTLELTAAQNGTTNVIVAGTALTTSDAFNIVLDQADGLFHNGPLNIDNIETVNIVTTVEDAALSNYGLNLTSADAETITLSGDAGVNFQSAFANLTSFDASGVTGEGVVGSVVVQTNTADNATLKGGAGIDFLQAGAGDDTISGGAGNDALVGQAGTDTINGGEGDDFISGGVGADTLTGDAGEDVFYFNVVADSQGVTVDTITDFVSGEDQIDLSSLEIGTGFYSGEANGYGAVLTSLTNSGSTQAVLDTSTSTLYVDINGDGVLDNSDMAINLTGVTDLAATDFQW